MKSFKEYAQNKDIEAIKSILIEEGYDEFSQEQLIALLEAGLLQRLGKSKIGKAAKAATLAAAMAGAGIGGSMMQKSSNDATNAAPQNSVAAAQQDDNATQSKTVMSPTRRQIQNKIDRVKNRKNQMRNSGVSHGSFVGGKLVK